MCNKPSSVIKLQENLREVMDIVSNMDKEINDCYATLRDCDLELEDLKHKMEFTNFNASMGYRLAKEMQDCMQRRRVAKDSISIITSTKKKFREMFKNSNSGLAKAFLHSIDQQSSAMEAREYKPRIREDLFS